MPKRVFVATRDLLFRAKLGATIAAAGGEMSRDDAACDLVVLELDDAGSIARIGPLMSKGTPVLAYGAHVRADLLSAARAAGATAVPNSQVVERLAGILAGRT